MWRRHARGFQVNQNSNSTRLNFMAKSVIGLDREMLETNLPIITKSAQGTTCVTL